MSKGWALDSNDKGWNYDKAEVGIKLGKTDEAIALADNFVVTHRCYLQSELRLNINQCTIEKQSRPALD